MTDNNTSKPLQLIGGRRYKIEFKSFNYSPLRYYNPYEVKKYYIQLSLSLSWEIDGHGAGIIPKEMFYSSPGGKLPRIFGLKGENYGMYVKSHLEALWKMDLTHLLIARNTIWRIYRASILA